MNQEPNQEELFKLERYDVILPLGVNNESIFNTERFEIKIWRENDTKIVFIRKKLKDKK